jgi:hypothetical protein
MSHAIRLILPFNVIDIMAASRIIAARAVWRGPQLAAIEATSRSIFGHIAPSTSNVRTGRKILRKKVTAAAGRLSDLKTAHRAMIVAERMELEVCTL